jgi:hypothetical protein
MWRGTDDLLFVLAGVVVVEVSEKLLELDGDLGVEV